ncbi:MAG TPA: hypothetical protein VHB27_00045 [Rhodopila sp.]|uniref:hypothetical protein n=1 Tax=Rhodopila sp. TaxID=2480087 RepID=UPI002C523A49|nr:hypothetical protein [Rhodopila sp.]HVY13586.1 hypothetical protein [Rhodopila sp.]
MRWLRWLGLLLAFGASLAPLAHVLELPNKLRLDGALWLGIQQHLYDGWGPLIGAPTEIGGLLVSVALVVTSLGRKSLFLLYGITALSYVAMILCFFLLNDPVNKALSGWTPATLPPDWPAYRLEWETGHALAALFGLLAVVTTGAGLLVANGTAKTK